MVVKFGAKNEPELFQFISLILNGLTSVSIKNLVVWPKFFLFTF